MALSDWTEQARPHDQYRRPTQASDGSWAWFIDSATGSSDIVTVRDETMPIAPVEAVIYAELYVVGGSFTVAGPIFHYQDIDNYFFVEQKPDTNDMYLKTVSGGSVSNTVNIGITHPGDTWYGLEVELYEDSGGQLTARCRTDTDLDGTFEDQATAAIAGHGGGAVGFGGPTNAASSFYVDAVEISY